jgi:CDP-glycerol glycerophosphotransferase (TagB/SpsB family)
VETVANGIGSEVIPGLLLYLDPGTGSLLFSVIVGLAATSFFVVKGLAYRAMAKLQRLLGHRGGPSALADEHALVLYSEGRQYASTFEPILRELASRGMPCTYLSSDPQDPLLACGLPAVTTRFIGRSYAAWGYLNTLRATLCVMTTPSLDVLQIKRSRHVRHYAHVIHSPTDKAFNRPYSFDYFDSVFTCGPHQERTIRFLEALRGTRVKSLVQAGCVYYDTLLREVRAAGDFVPSGDSRRVLVAPTWGKNGLLRRYGMRVLQPLLEAGCSVMLRPHPQSATAEPDLLEELRRLTAKYPNCHWDDRENPVWAMVNSDILVSDISGIVFDYGFLVGRPVVTMDFEVDRRGFEASDLPYIPWELEVLETVGRTVSEPDIAQLPRIVESEITNQDRRRQIENLRNRYVVNFGHAAPAIVDALDDLLRRLASGDTASVEAAAPHGRPAGALSSHREDARIPGSA